MSAQEDGIPLGAIEDFDIGTARVVDGQVDGSHAQIAVFHAEDGNFYAIDDMCPHEDASLAEGFLEGTEIECPLHAGAVCLRTGKATALPIVTDTRTHAVRVADGQLWLYPGVPAGAT
ncbi:MAG: 2Fe-2S ferredoxin [Micrococcales bacterium]|nr:MAG: 2Fe-2S ferredoxin [Micrococcales bacterium]